MKMKIQSGSTNRRNYVAMIAIIVCAFGLLMQQSSVVSILDHQLFDKMQQVFGSRQQDAKVLLVYASTETMRGQNGHLNSILREINDCRPRKIAIICDEHPLISNELNVLPFAENIAIGCKKNHWHQQLKHGGMIQGIIDLELSNQSTYRDHYLAAESKTQRYPSIECAIAASMLQPHLSPKQNRFGIRYCGSNNSLPQVTEKQVMDDSLVASLVQDKVVLIGVAEKKQFGIRTPTTVGNARMNRLEVHGHILETLLRGNYISDVHWVAQFTLLALFSAASTLLIIRSKLQNVPWRIATAFLAACLLATTSYHFFNVRLPATSLGSSILLSSVIAIFLRFRVLERYIRELELSTQNKAGDETETWELIRLSALQMFYPSLMVMMELPPGKAHLKFVDCCNCDQSKVGERRRDIQRFPFRHVYDMERPCKFSGYKFFEGTGNDQVEYYIPLMHDSVVFGMVIASLSVEKLKNWSNIDECLAHFSVEMSRLLQEQRIHETAENASQRFAAKLNVLPEESTLEAILRRERQLNNQLQRWEHAVRSSETAIAICDPFGRVEFGNEKLLTMLDRHQLVATDANTLELIASISGRDIAHCRRLLRNVLNERIASQMYLPAAGSNGNALHLNIKPIITNTIGKTSTHYPYIIIEIVDGTVFETVANWQQDLTSKLCETASDSVVALADELIRIEESDLDSESLKNLLGKLNQTMQVVESTLTSCQDIAESELSDQHDRYLPIETLTVFDRIKEKYCFKFSQNETQLSVDTSEESAVAVANPFLLHNVFELIFDILLKRAFSGSKISIAIDKVDALLRYEFQGSGGVANQSRDQFAKKSGAQTDREALDQEFGDRIHEVRDWLEAWGGTLKIFNGDEDRLNVELLLDANLIDQSDRMTRTSRTTAKLG